MKINLQRSRLGNIQKRSNVTLSNEIGVILSYVGQIYIGSNKQIFDVVFDTGSCPMWVRGFDRVSSNTFSTVGRRAYPVTYMDGTTVTGNYIFDTVSVGNITVNNMEVLDVESISPEGHYLSGIIGLCQNTNDISETESRENEISETFIDAASRLMQIKGKIFSFVISPDLKSGSLYLDDIPLEINQTVIWISTYATDTHWKTPLTAIKVSNDIIKDSNDSGNNASFDVIFDTGTSLTHLPSSVSQEIHRIMGYNLNTEQGIYFGPCILENKTISFSFGESLLILSLNDFIYRNGASSDQKCFSGIVDSQNNVSIFGNSFLKNYHTIFNGVNNTVGFSSVGTASVGGNDNERPGSNSITGNKSAAGIITCISLAILVFFGILIIGRVIYKYIKKG